MSKPRYGRPERQRGALLLGALVGCALLAVIALAAAYAQRTISDIRRLQTATSDNVQWTMPQVEVEFLYLQNALDYRDAQGNADLEEIRLRYDVLYSRVQTLRKSPMFDALASQPAFVRSLSAVSTFMDRAIPLIDGSDAQLTANLDRFSNAAGVVRKHVRTLSVSGLGYFSRQTDLRREQVTSTLVQLALTTGGLFLALTALSGFLFLVYRKTDARGEALAQANQRMNTILSTSLDGVIVTDSDGRVLEFNNAAEDIFGLSQADMLGRRIDDVIHPSDPDTPLPADGVRGFSGSGRVQLRAVRADHTDFPVEFALQSARYADQEIFIGFLRDISEREQARELLIEARDRALAGEKAKTDFLTVMSHEIRTPLNGLLGNLTLMENTDPTDKQAEYLHNMEVSGRILMDHVDSILDVSRYDAGKLAITRAPFNLEHLLQDLVDGLHSMAQAQGTTISWTWTGHTHHWVKADGQRLQQVLLNLVGNAIKFTRDGQVIVEVDMSPDAGSDLLNTEIRVCDTGIGIPADTIDRVFDDFHTRDSSFDRVQGGTGLGLGISRRLVQAMGGEIGVESIPGTGSTFWIRLPLTPAAPPRDTTTDRAVAPTLPAKHILVVEDNAINRQVAQAMLEQDGHKVTCASDGQSGVDQAQATRFDLILMDISMPGMDGLEATRRIRSGKGQSADVPVVALSANVLPQDKQRFTDAGMDAFLGKPLKVSDLRASLAALATESVPDQQPRRANRPEMIDWSQLANMRDTLPPGAFAALLRRFLDEGRSLSDRLRHDPDHADLPDVSATCHKIAGSAAVFGATPYRDGLLRLEKAAAEDDATAAASVAVLIPQVLDLWDETNLILGDELAKANATQDETVRQPDTTDVLRSG